MATIDIIAGARPNFMKIAPIIRAIEMNKKSGGKLDYRLIHTGQHYDNQMSGNFFKQLQIPDPHVNLEAGSGTQAEQTAAIMVRYEKLLLSSPSKLCMVVGDVNSTMACAISAKKLCIPVAHVEAGIRSGDRSMPEEINRIVTDSITDYFFTTSELAGKTLLKSGISERNVFFVGNTMIDTLLMHQPRFRAPTFWNTLNLTKQGYFVLTLHRASNVDSSEQLKALLALIGASCRNLPIIFPAHPRTKKKLSEIAALSSNITIVDPQDYLEFNFLVENAKAVITDSGGVTEETTVMNIPCLTLRDSTERPETVTMGTNELLGSNGDKIAEALDRVFRGVWKKGSIPPRWDGKAAERIVGILSHRLEG